MHTDKNTFIIYYYLPIVYLLTCYTNIIIFLHVQIWNIKRSYSKMFYFVP
jgi:hypothetical protein